MSEVRKYEYTVVSFHYKNKSPAKLQPTTRKVMRDPQVIINPKFVLHGLTLGEARAIGSLEIGDTYVDHFGDRWKKLQ